MTDQTNKVLGRRVYPGKEGDGFHHRSVDIFGYHRFYNDKDQLHRDGAPAIQTDGGENYWCQNGQFHREDGPAHHHKSGVKRWYLLGQELNFPQDIAWEILPKEELKTLLFKLLDNKDFLIRNTNSACGCY